MDGTPTTISMTEAEMALYQSGQRRGHAECLRQIASQIRVAANGYKSGTGTGRLDPVADCFENFAKQLDEPAAQATNEQQQLLDKWCEIRAVTNRTLATRVRDLIGGALAGWRGQ